MDFTDPGKERAIIGCVIAETFHLLPSYPPPEVFTEDCRRLVYQAALGLLERKKHVCIESVNDRLKDTGNYRGIQKALHPVAWESWSTDTDSSIAFSQPSQKYCLDALLECYHRREAHHIAGELHSGGISFSEAYAQMGDLQRLMHGANGHDLRRFDMSRLHEKPVPVLTLDGNSIATSGNLTSIFAQAKAGKSAVVGAIIGAVIAEGGIGDFLSWSAPLNLDGAALLHFDTEQSPYDHEQIVLRAMKRAGLEQPPPWLYSYYLTDTGIEERRTFISHAMSIALKAHKRILAVLIDGVGDCVLDVNDVAESNTTVTEFHSLAIQYDTVMVMVLHENPDSTGKGNVKMRGHLGSVMERKSESNVRLLKDDKEVTTQYTGKSRHASISQAKGPRFAFDPIQGMHVSVDPGAPEQASEDDRCVVREMFNEVIGGLNWTQCHEAIEQIEGLKRAGSRKRFKKYVALGLITKSGADSEHYVMR